MWARDGAHVIRKWSATGRTWAPNAESYAPLTGTKIFFWGACRLISTAWGRGREFHPVYVLRRQQPGAYDRRRPSRCGGEADAAPALCITRTKNAFMNALFAGYPFYKQLASTINSGQSRSVLLWGNVYDLFQVDGEPGGGYVPLVDFLCQKIAGGGWMLLVYELNGPIRFISPGDKDKLRQAWVAWRSDAEPEDLTLKALANRQFEKQKELLENRFEADLLDSVGKPTVALEFLRQLTLCSRQRSPGGKRYLAENLFIIIEAADLLLPAGEGDISRLNPADRRRVGIVQDWFSDPGFVHGEDSVVMLAESRSQVHPRVARLPQLGSVEVPAPDADERLNYIRWFVDNPQAQGAAGHAPKLWAADVDLALHGGSEHSRFAAVVAGRGP